MPEDCPSGWIPGSHLSDPETPLLLLFFALVSYFGFTGKMIVARKRTMEAFGYSCNPFNSTSTTASRDSLL